jgi:hypothetical protein
MTTAGYSSTPLSKKLGLKSGSRVHLIGAPTGYRALLRPLPAGVKFAAPLSAATDLVHLFATRRAELKQALVTVRRKLRADATIWVSWPKQASRVPTNITEDVVREVALALGLVDVKVCAVDATWSGLKLVVRKTLR